jgi:hypothetical protein
MSDELKPVRCGCGGEAIIGLKEWEDRKGNYHENSFVYCNDCSISTGGYLTEAEAIEAWNTAMGTNTRKLLEVLVHDATDTNVGDKFDKDIDVPAKERTAKVVEHDASVTDTDGYKYHRSEYLCGACKKKVIGGDEYCSHCGARLEWE